MSDGKIEGCEGRSWMGRRERGALLALIPTDGLCLEIGTADGVTVRWLARERPDAMFVSVDIFPGKDTEVQGALGNLALWRTNAQPNQSLWLGTARQMADTFPVRVFDVTLVDAEHTYASCAEDIAAACVLTNAQGTIALHDYTRPQNGVRAASEAVAVQWYVAEIVGSMAILRRSEDVELMSRLRSLGYA